MLLDSVFPPTHAIVHRWKALAARVAAQPHDLKLKPTVAEARGILQAARALVEADHLRTFARECAGTRSIAATTARISSAPRENSVGLRAAAFRRAPQPVTAFVSAAS